MSVIILIRYIHHPPPPPQGTTKIDLHGLNMSVALAAVANALDQHVPDGSGLVIVTGQVNMV
jgi:hypothetical protein